MAQTTADDPEPTDLIEFYENRDVERDPALADSASDLGARIAEARSNLEMSRAELGQHLGVRPTTIGRWERGGSTPRPNYLNRIAGVLGVSLSWLVIGRGESPTDDAELDQVRQELAMLHRTLAEALAAVDRMTALLDRPPSST